MLTCQNNKFKIPNKVTYLNCAFMSPLLKSVEKIGHDAVSKKCLPFNIEGKDFFEETFILKQKFAELTHIKDAKNIAVIPSVSYGIANITNSLQLEENDEIIVLEEQFPSHIYSWQKLANKFNAKLTIISSPNFIKRGEQWNAKILKAITTKTKVVAIPHVHWSDGTLFDLKAIRKKTKIMNALLIIDGTQSVGALPFSVEDIQPDALICAGYKWLLGPYSIGLAYYSDQLCKGNPIEENWINRKNSEDFTKLVNYEAQYKPKAERFNVGEVSNFALTPMLIESIDQLLKWTPEKIQEYCTYISQEAITKLREIGCYIEDSDFRGSHLFGIYLPENIDIENLKREFVKNNIYVSFRGNAIRIAPHVYNNKEDFDNLVKCFEKVMY